MCKRAWKATFLPVVRADYLRPLRDARNILTVWFVNAISKNHTYITAIRTNKGGRPCSDHSIPTQLLFNCIFSLKINQYVGKSGKLIIFFSTKSHLGKNVRQPVWWRFIPEKLLFLKGTNSCLFKSSNISSWFCFHDNTTYVCVCVCCHCC